MRNAILGILLFVFIFGAVFAQHKFTQSAEYLLEPARAAAEAVRAEDWTRARSEFSALAERWKKLNQIWELLVPHNITDSIASSIEQSEASLALEDPEESLILLALVHSLIDQAPRRYALNWGNIL